MKVEIEITDAGVLLKALLRARAAERTEVSRANTLVVTGYGDRAGGTLSQEADAAQKRIDALTEVIEVVTAKVTAKVPDDIPSFLRNRP